jgi:hypothetical protein
MSAGWDRTGAENIWQSCRQQGGMLPCLSDPSVCRADNAEHMTLPNASRGAGGGLAAMARAPTSDLAIRAKAKSSVAHRIQLSSLMLTSLPARIFAAPCVSAAAVEAR